MNENHRILFAALGNPGKRYEKTRHNIGFIFADSVSAHYGFSPFSYCPVFRACISTGIINKKEVIFVKPHTYMNLSGKAIVPAIKAFNVILPENLFVIHDDLDIDFGNQKIKFGGRDGGHKGVRSIMTETETSEFYRIKLGIGKPEQNIKPESYVLDKFLDEERAFVDNVWCSEWNDLVETLLCDGVEKTMNKYNKRRQKV